MQVIGMVRYRRNWVPGGTYFFTVTLADRRSHVLVDHIAALGDAFRVTQAEAAFTVEAVVVLPEHLHAIFTLPDGDADYARRWRRIKGRFTSTVRATKHCLVADARGAYRLWQSRYWEHTLRDEDDFARHVDYIHINPVKHGLVTRAMDWPHSSFHRYVREGRLPEDWAGTPCVEAEGFGERG